MKKLLIQILLTMLLTGCESAWNALDITLTVAEINENNRQHKCNMDHTQCAKYNKTPINDIIDQNIDGIE